MNNCNECGLPMAVCNALAMYRQAEALLERERYTEAFQFMLDAKKEYERYIEWRRTQP